MVTHPIFYLWLICCQGLWLAFYLADSLYLRTGWPVVVISFITALMGAEAFAKAIPGDEEMEQASHGAAALWACLLAALAIVGPATISSYRFEWWWMVGAATCGFAFSGVGLIAAWSEHRWDWRTKHCLAVFIFFTALLVPEVLSRLAWGMDRKPWGWWWLQAYSFTGQGIAGSVWLWLRITEVKRNGMGGWIRY